LSAIGALVERHSNFTMLVHLPDGYKPDQVAPALTRRIQVFFCDPHSLWQSGINENTNGLLRQYFPKGTSLDGFTEGQLDAVARDLNDRPRKRLEFQTPN
jgi:IS30 family transposase